MDVLRATGHEAIGSDVGSGGGIFGERVAWQRQRQRKGKQGGTHRGLVSVGVRSEAELASRQANLPMACGLAERAWGSAATAAASGLTW